MGKVLGGTPLLEHGLGLDLGVLQLDELIVLLESPKSSKHCTSFRLAAVMNKPSGREWHEGHTNSEDDSGCQLQAQRHKPSAILLGIASSADVLSSIVDPKAQHDTSLWLCQSIEVTNYSGRRSLR